MQLNGIYIKQFEMTMNKCSKCGIITDMLTCQTCFDKWYIKNKIKMSNRFTRQERNHIYINATYNYNGIAFNNSLSCCFLSDNYKEFYPLNFPEFMLFSPDKPTEYCWWNSNDEIALGLAFMIVISE